ncbi:hypothetical protein LTR78_001881 [Recurvomyces mirabilis]|uniref:Uncharacterized protein n=1 Tax=Recurvomyces mirabilis TaxID=574656 RepID=A0AAE0WVG9_9PEZI|nr:hypothetical protein LTR78_001881 [Recurvomyces mirabilis]KAK5156679.1 hypothetical protein LTS14_004891 [Recurvomyces mirabilis]
MAEPLSPKQIPFWLLRPETATYHNVAAADEEGPSPAEEIAKLRPSQQKIRLCMKLKIPPQALETLPKTSLPVPTFPTVFQTLDQDDRFAVSSSPDSHKAWHSLVPKAGTGFVEIDNPRQHPSLEPGMIGRDFNHEVFGVSIFHQLHCLIHIRHHFWALDGLASSTTTTTPTSTSTANQTQTQQLQKLHRMNGHINPSFDFVRQALMCNADLALEWPRTVEDSGGPEGSGVHGIVDGNHTPHQCKDWDAIYEEAGKNAWAQDQRV